MGTMGCVQRLGQSDRGMLGPGVIGRGARMGGSRVTSGG